MEMTKYSPVPKVLQFHGETYQRCGAIIKSPSHFNGLIEVETSLFFHDGMSTPKLQAVEEDSYVESYAGEGFRLHHLWCLREGPSLEPLKTCLMQWRLTSWKRRSTVTSALNGIKKHIVVTN